MSVSTPRLSVVADGQRAAGRAAERAQATTREIAALVAANAAAPRIRVTPWQRMQIEEARKLLTDAPELFATKPDAYVAGLIEGAASNLLHILDAIAEV